MKKDTSQTTCDQILMKVSEIKINPMFKDICPPLTQEEFLELDLSIGRDGVLSPLVLWHDTSAIGSPKYFYVIDGHNRLKIAQQKGIEYVPVVVMTFKCIDDIYDWMKTNQIARRNLTPAQKEELIGRQYKSEKKSEAGRPKKSTQSEAINKAGKTSEKIAKQHNVSKATVERAGKLVEAIDKIEAINPKAAEKIRTGQSVVPRGEIRNLAKATDEKVKEVAQNIVDDKPRSWTKDNINGNPSDFLKSAFRNAADKSEDKSESVLDSTNFMNDVVAVKDLKFIVGEVIKKVKRFIDNEKVGDNALRDAYNITDNLFDELYVLMGEMEKELEMRKNGQFEKNKHLKNKKG